MLTVVHAEWIVEYFRFVKQRIESFVVTNVLSNISFSKYFYFLPHLLLSGDHFAILLFMAVM